MTQEEINYYRAAASLSLIPDEINPLFIFNQTHTDILIDIVNGSIDPIQLSRIELRNRGVDEKTGRWVGWGKGEDSYQII